MPAAAWSQAVVPTLTIVEGPGTIISGSEGFLPAPGVKLRQCDVVATGPQALLQVELDDGGKFVLGPESRFVFDLPHGGDPVVGPHLLQSGWVKLTVPKRENALRHRIDTPHFGVTIDSGVTVVRAGADASEFFVEQGEAVALIPDGASFAQVTVAAGRAYARKSGQDRGTTADRVNPAFLQAMPASFRDTLPSLLPQLKARDVQPKPAPNYRHADSEAWLRSVPQLRLCAVDQKVLAAQQVLERNGLNVGPLDGILGPRTAAALREFQQQRGLPRTGKLDAETLKALDLPAR